MPPLRDWMDDIPQLVEHFLAKYRSKPDAIPTPISEEAVARLMEHDWPGNVRELENAIERAVVLSRGMTITPDHLPFAAGQAARDRARLVARKVAEASEADAHEPDTEDAHANGDATEATEMNGHGTFKGAVAELEKRLIREALERAGGNRSKAAEELGIYRRLLYTKIREYGLGD
jgi:DNA-binding NtrC family response regulator